MQTIPLFVVPQIVREASGGTAVNAIDLGAIVLANTPPGTVQGRMSLSLSRDIKLGL